MSFVIVDIQPGGGSGEISIGQAGKAVEIYTLIADDIFHSTEDVRNSGLFPEVYTTFHAMNPRLRLQPLEIEQDSENPGKFTVTVTWSSEKMDPKDEEEKQDSPLDRKARVTVKTNHMREVKHRDFYGRPKMNASGDLFDPPVESNASFLVIEIRKNVTVFPDWIFAFSDAVNLFDFVIKGRTIKKGTAWIASIELGEENTDGPIPYCEARVEMHIRKKRKPVIPDPPDDDNPPESIDDVPDPWKAEILNEGYFGIDIETAERYRIKVKDPDNVMVFAPAPVPLTLLGEPITNPTVDSATFLVFQDHEELDFASIAFLWSNA